MAPTGVNRSRQRSARFQQDIKVLMTHLLIFVVMYSICAAVTEPA